MSLKKPVGMRIKNRIRTGLNLIESLPGSWSACFVGDDKTDEEAFETLGGRALTVRVGPALKSKARFLLKNRGYVHSFLELIAEKKYEKINQA